MRLGIRLQLLLAIGSLLVLALVPLYVATTQLTHATMAVARESAARALGRATAAHVLAASAWSAPDVVQPVLEAQVGEGGLEAVALYEGDGERSVVAGDAEALAVLPATLTEPVEASRAVRVGDRRALLVIVPAPGVQMMFRTTLLLVVTELVIVPGVKTIGESTAAVRLKVPG